MPFSQNGLLNVSGNLENRMRESVDDVFAILDGKIKELASARDLPPNQVRLLQPVHCAVLVGATRISVVMSIHDLGVMAIRNYTDLNDEDFDIPTAIRVFERDLGVQNAFGFQFMRSVLELDDEQKELAITQIAERYIADEIVYLERQNRLVRINPVFQGRDFLIDEQLVFVLSPFGDPFDTIYPDHIKPTIEAIAGLRCLRADDIYDNRAIIEDIWQYTNEARILISELTDRNPNVFYETGIAHTIGKEVILITQSMDDVPFDLRHLRCIVYDYTPRGMQNLEDNLKNTVVNILTRRN